MPRPSEPIKARRGPRGYYLVSFAEAPGRYFTTPVQNAEGPDSTEGRGPALAWARRNRERLLSAEEKPLRLRDFCREFFEPGSPWVARMKDKGHVYGKRYLGMRQGHLDNYIVPLLGDEDPREVSGRVIDDAIRAAVKRGGGPLAPATKYKIVYTLNIILEDLVETKIIDRNPLDGVKPYSHAPVNPRGTISREAIPKLFPPTHGELVRVWGSAMWASMMLSFLDTGMRPIELAARTWGDLYVETIGERELWSFVFMGAKNRKYRAVGISTRTAQELKIWRAQSRHHEDSDFIFTASGDSPIDDASVLKAFRRCVQDVVGPSGAQWTTYWLRHTFVTNSIAALSEIEVAMLAGHSVQVDRIYQHADVQIALDRSREARIKLETSRETNKAP